MVLKNRINKESVVLHLQEARDEIDLLIASTLSGQLDDLESIAMGYCFKPVLENLCLAWHSKWMSFDDLNGFDDDINDIMRDSIPNWGLTMRLVDIDEPSEFDLRDNTSPE